MVGVSDHPLRYLHNAVHAMALFTNIVFSDFARLSRPLRWTWLEVVAARGPISADGFAVAMDYVFREDQNIRHTGKPSFRSRLEHSDCLHLLPAYLPSEADALESQWQERPVKRLKLLHGSLNSSSSIPIDPNLWRFPGHLAVEAAILTQFRAIMSSWKTYRSGISAWARWAAEMQPFGDPFHVMTDTVLGFSSMFSMGSTFQQYWGHVRFALRILNRPANINASVVAQCVRGCKKARPGRLLHRLQRPQVTALIDVALELGRYDFARFFIVGRTFLFRIMNECFPLQLNGRQGLRPDSIAWHSQIVFSRKTVTVHLRTRKAHPNGDSLIRKCSCTDTADFYCPFHALLTQTSGRPAHAPIWNFSQSTINDFFSKACVLIGLVPNVGWHAFRRGMATDMIESGSTVSFILRAGGWRSSAFLKYLTSSGLDLRESVEYAMHDSDSDQE